jgi:hypothetical protein
VPCRFTTLDKKGEEMVVGNAMAPPGRGDHQVGKLVGENMVRVWPQDRAR